MSNDPLTHKAILYTVDGISAGAIVATFLGLLPSFAAVAGIIWYGIQIYESKTVQAWVAKMKAKKNEQPPTDAS